MAELSESEYNKQINEALAFFADKNKPVPENIINNSVAKKPRRVIEVWHRGVVLGMAVGVAVSVIVALYILLSNNIINKYEEQKAMREALEQYNNRGIIAVVEDAEETYREPGKVEYEKNHNAYNIANYLINESENFHEDFYLAAREIDKVSEYADADVERVVDNVIAHSNNLNDENNPNHVLDYASWKDYCEKHGFVDEKGEPSFEKYMSEMTQYMADKTNTTDFEDEHGIRGYR